MNTPDATTFLIAGFLLTWGAVAWYAWRLERRLEEARSFLDSLSEGDA